MSEHPSNKKLNTLRELQHQMDRSADVANACMADNSGDPELPAIIHDELEPA